MRHGVAVTQDVLTFQRCFIAETEEHSSRSCYGVSMVSVALAAGNSWGTLYDVVKEKSNLNYVTCMIH